MGLILSAIAAIVGSTALGLNIAVAAKESGDKKRKEKFEALEKEWKETEKTYNIRREALVERQMRGDKKAAKQIAELDKEHALKRIEYEEERGKLVPEYVNKKIKEETAKKDPIADCSEKDCSESLPVPPTKPTPPKSHSKASKERICEICGMKIPSDSKFCSYCGSKVTILEDKFCTNCGQKVSADSAFCHRCGHKL